MPSTAAGAAWRRPSEPTPIDRIPVVAGRTTSPRAGALSAWRGVPLSAHQLVGVICHPDRIASRRRRRHHHHRRSSCYVSRVLLRSRGASASASASANNACTSANCDRNAPRLTPAALSTRDVGVVRGALASADCIRFAAPIRARRVADARVFIFSPAARTELVALRPEGRRTCGGRTPRKPMLLTTGLLSVKESCSPFNAHRRRRHGGRPSPQRGRTAESPQAAHRP